jgi:hypothetical protein
MSIFQTSQNETARFKLMHALNSIGEGSNKLFWRAVLDTFFEAHWQRCQRMICVSRNAKLCVGIVAPAGNAAIRKQSTRVLATAGDRTDTWKALDYHIMGEVRLIEGKWLMCNVGLT